VPQIGGRCVVDLTPEEELCSSAALQVAVDGGGALCGLTKRRRGGIDVSMALVGGHACAPGHAPLLSATCSVLQDFDCLLSSVAFYPCHSLCVCRR
jgi:hypothetical protein